MPSSTGFDPQALKGRLEDWLATRLEGAGSVEVTDLDAPEATGHSSETVMFDATWTRGGTTEVEQLVLRTAPGGHTVFPTYDLGLQYEVMLRVGAASDVPLPPLRWYESDPSWIGNEFFVMGRVEGKVPPDRLPYTMQGWLLEESTPEEQRTLQLSGVEVLARLHAIDWRAAGLDILDQRRHGATGLDQQLGFYEAFLEWGRGDHPHPRLHATARWLRDHRPEPEPDPVLNWGDSRIGNMMFVDHRPVAVLDWEMATLGPPEVDLAWWCLFERFFSTELDTPNLPGFLPMEDVVAHYEQASGRTVGDLGWYTVWAAHRYAVVMMRICQADALRGEAMFPEDDNVATAMLDRVLAEVDG
ncbi:MAG: phosphotransferase family protein [Microthrixaceae bacterium]